jgi:hypothetical protein
VSPRPGNYDEESGDRRQIRAAPVGHEASEGDLIRGAKPGPEAHCPSGSVRFASRDFYPLILPAWHEADARLQILTLEQFFIGKHCTVLPLDHRTSEGSDLQLQSLAHRVLPSINLLRDSFSGRARRCSQGLCTDHYLSANGRAADSFRFQTDTHLDSVSDLD